MLDQDTFTTFVLENLAFALGYWVKQMAGKAAPSGWIPHNQITLFRIKRKKKIYYPAKRASSSKEFIRNIVSEFLCKNIFKQSTEPLLDSKIRWVPSPLEVFRF